MKRYFVYIIILLLYSYFNVTGQWLNGIYNINPSGSYPTFSSAVDSLILYGVSGPVEFIVFDGIYTEQIVISPISGASAINTITFIPKEHDSTLVTLVFNGNYTVSLDGADHIRFLWLTIKNPDGHAFEFSNEADSNLISNCVMEGQATISTSENLSVLYSSGGNNNGNIIQISRIRNGSFGIYSIGENTASLETGTIIQNNIFIDQHYTGIWLENQDAPQVLSNSLNNPDAIQNIHLINCDNGFKIIGNITLEGSIRVIHSHSTPGEEAIIANNFVKTSHGSGIIHHWSSYIKNYYNSVYLHGSTNYIAAYYCGYQNSHIITVNNIFSCFGAGYSVLLRTELDSLISDYNLLYSTGNYICASDLGGYINYQTFYQWQAYLNQEFNSLNIAPVFFSDNDFHTNQIELDGRGIPVSEIENDIDGEPRHELYPDIGADEFAITPEILISSDTSIICGESLHLFFFVNFPNAIFQWTHGECLDNPNISNPVAIPTETTTFTVSATNPLYSVTDSVVIIVENISHFSYSTNGMSANFTMASNLCAENGFMWDFGNGITSTTVQNPPIIYSLPGAYTVCLNCGTLASGCEKCVVITIPSLDTGSTVSTAIFAFPERISVTLDSKSEMLYITTGLSFTSSYRLYIYDTSGRQIWNRYIIEGEKCSEFDISYFPTGLYFLYLAADNFSVKQKFFLTGHK
ncbi:MAG: PKD domain-containing protein [Bacteroidia bacterium]|nr:PKD domain-containing protein [Bacteroidia bacterium]